jgi:hypothetical protein
MVDQDFHGDIPAQRPVLLESMVLPAPVSAIASGATPYMQISSTRMPCTRTIERSIIGLLASSLIIRGMDA